MHGVTGAVGDRGDMDHCCALQLQYKFGWLFRLWGKYSSIWFIMFDEWPDKIQELIDTRWLYNVRNCRFVVNKWDKLLLFATKMDQTLEPDDNHRPIWRQVASWMHVPIIFVHLLMTLAFGE